VQPQIPVAALPRVLLVTRMLRRARLLAVEAWVRSPARRELVLRLCFSDDGLAHCAARLDVERLHSATIEVVKQAIRNKEFQESSSIG